MNKRSIPLILLGVAGTFLGSCASSSLDEEDGSETHFQCSANPDCEIIGSSYACIEGFCKIASCVPGQSIACTGPGGCAGGQVCSADGTQYGECDCGGTTGSADASAYERATMPPPPDPGSIVNTDIEIGPIVSVMRRIDLGDRQPNPADPPTAYLEIGFDLDNILTTADDLTAAECTLPLWAPGVVDGPGGIDNAWGGIAQGTRDMIQDFNSLNASMELEEGGSSLAIRVSRFNGEENDDLVAVDVFRTGPFDTLVSPTSDGGTVTVGPAWNGEDTWPIASDSLINPTDPDPLSRPKFSDSHGYVSGGKLVAMFPNLEQRLLIPIASLAVVDLKISLTLASMVCDVEEVPGSGSGFNVTNCTVGGRWNTDDFIHQLSHFPDPAPTNGRDVGGPLCTDAEYYQRFKTAICSLTDIFDGVARPDSVCNAISVGFEFEAYPAVLGDVAFLDPALPRCPAEIEPSNDSCSTLQAP